MVAFDCGDTEGWMVSDGAARKAGNADDVAFVDRLAKSREHGGTECCMHEGDNVGGLRGCRENCWTCAVGLMKAGLFVARYEIPESVWTGARTDEDKFSFVPDFGAVVFEDSCAAGVAHLAD